MLKLCRATDKSAFALSSASPSITSVQTQWGWWANEQGGRRHKGSMLKLMTVRKPRMEISAR